MSRDEKSDSDGSADGRNRGWTDADINSEIRELKTDFQRIADRAPWIRAVFSVRDGTFGVLSFGRAESPKTPAVLSSRDDEIPWIFEVDTLTGLAGKLWNRLLRQPGRHWETLCSGGPVHYRVTKPREVWLVFLLHSFPNTLLSKSVGPDGEIQWAPALCNNAEKETFVWIDNYPQVCVSALTQLAMRSVVKSKPVALLPPGVRGRNQYFRERAAQGERPCDVRDGWNALSHEERKRIGGQAAGKPLLGRSGYETVYKAITDKKAVNPKKKLTKTMKATKTK